MRETEHKGAIKIPVQIAYVKRTGIALAACVIAAAASPFGQGFEFLYQTLGGGIYATSGSVPSPFGMLVVGIPPLIFCYLFSDYVKEGLSHAGSSIFTRTARRSTWFRKRIIHLAGFVCIYSLFGTLLSTLVQFAMSDGNAFLLLNPSTQNFWAILEFLVVATILNALMLLTLLIPINILSLHADAVVCFIAVMAMYFSSLLICAALPHDATALLVPLLPTTQGVFAWHDTPLAHAMSGQGIIEGFSLLHSSVYLFVLVGLEVALAMTLAKRFELS